MEEEKCPECGGYTGHSPLCSLMSGDDAKRMLADYYALWLAKENDTRDRLEIRQSMVRKARHEAEFWKGKFMVVKHENNQLRKKIK